MEAWPGIIIEWVNCLEVLEIPTKDLKELEDGAFYKTILKLIKWESKEHSTDEKNILVQFLKEEYPEFKIDNECDKREKTHVYVASLFLLHTSQNPVFHQPMCTKLQPEAQTKIKTFLELVIPYGSNVTLETVKYAIAELGDIITTNTPMTPRTRGLRDFFNSPAAHSAQSYKALAERNRELIKLKNDLEAERFEKAELQEDLEIYKNKLQKLQLKLHERTAELKSLRDEHFNPPTPQSCKKEQSNGKLELYYKKEIDRLENQLMEKQIELDTSEENNQKLEKQLSSTEKQCLKLKEKVESGEKTLENLQIQAELKDSELANLKRANDDLRTYIKELTKSPTDEESFDISGVRPLYSPTSSLNTSEALSSVIEVQLHEAREESNFLKEEVETLHKTIATMTKEHQRVVELSAVLGKDAEKLHEVEAELKSALIKISLSSKEIKDLRQDQVVLGQQKDQLEEVVITQKKDLSKVEKEKEDLRLELGKMNEKHIELEKSLVEGNKRRNEIDTALSEARSIIQHLETEKGNYKASTESCKINLMKMAHELSKHIPIANNNVDELANFQFDECVKKILVDVKREYDAKEVEIRSLNSTLNESHVKVSNLESEISQLQKDYELHIVDISSLKEKINGNNSVIRDLSVCKEQLLAREQDLLEEINKSQVHFKETLEKLSNDYNTLQKNYDKEQACKKDLETKIADNEKEIKGLVNARTALEKELSETQQMKDTLKLDLMEIKKERTQLSENVKQLEATLKEEVKRHENDFDAKLRELESLKSEKTKLNTDLKSSNDKLNLAQQELNAARVEIKLKNEKLENLVCDMSLLKVEKEHLSRLQAKVESKTKEFVEQLEVQILEKQCAYDQLALQIKLKEDTIGQLQKEKIEWYSSELKMKEVIMNLQEVRVTQDSLLKTQEMALKEKTLQLGRLQDEFQSRNESLNNQIENEKSLYRGLQDTCMQLQEQSRRQMTKIEELEEHLTKERQDKESIKEYCQSENAKRLEIVRACEMLEGLVDELKSTVKDAKDDIDDIYAGSLNITFTECDDKLRNILNIMQSAINEMHASRKLISHLYNSNTILRKTLDDQELLVQKHNNNCKEMEVLRSKVLELEGNEQKRVKHFTNLIKRKRYLKASLQSIFTSREDLGVALSTVEQKWDEIATRFKDIFASNGCLSDELKCLQTKKCGLNSAFHKYNISHLGNLSTLNTILWQKFLWIEDQLESSSSDAKVNDSETAMDRIFPDEENIISSELEKNEALQKDVVQLENEIADFANEVAAFKATFDAGEMKYECESEKKLKAQINELIEEKDNLKSKMDVLRVMNTQLNGEGEELKNNLKELKAETVPLREAEDLRKDLKHMKEDNKKLREEIDELYKRPNKEEFDRRVKEMNDKYEAKLDEVKQKMKSSYSQQIEKLHKDQENNIRERLESFQGKMELLCRKQADEINKYKSHVSELSSQFWTVGEKLLSEKQHKQELEKELNELKAKYHNLKLQLNQHAASVTSLKNIKTERRDLPASDYGDQLFQNISVVKEKATFERRCSIQSLQTMGNVFNAEDEEGEVFDNTYLADIKDGQQSFLMDPERMSVLKLRNSMCKPHLKSSYPAEMQFHPLPFTEEEIKSGHVPEDNFNDSLSQSLLPEQKAKKRDKTQTSYRKPGPPTPSKNGGRLSLQGSELKSPNSKILRERNKELRTTSTPRTLKSLFSSRRQDENTLSTPKERRRSSIFRKSRITTNR